MSILFNQAACCCFNLKNTPIKYENQEQKIYLLESYLIL